LSIPVSAEAHNAKRSARLGCITSNRVREPSAGKTHQRPASGAAGQWLCTQNNKYPAPACREGCQVRIAARSVVRYLDAARRAAGHDPGRLRHFRAPPDQGAHRCRQEASQGPRRAVRATAKVGSATLSGSDGGRICRPPPSAQRRGGCCVRDI
jgi:hypothetical protein